MQLIINLRKMAQKFTNWDYKIHQGLAQSGHYVYPYSVSDMARMRSITGHRDLGRRACNKALIKVCENVHPDMLLLGHAQLITRKTLETIRLSRPDIKIAFWYCDAIWEGMDNDHLFERMDMFDAMFISTGGDVLKQFAGPKRLVSFVPNPVEPSIERHRAFDNDEPEFDLVFFGRDAPERNQIIQKLLDNLPDVRFGIFGCLGNPRVYGHAREAILARSRMALNLSRNNKTYLCSSNRLVDTIGNGLMTFCDDGNGLQPLFSNDEVAYYRDTDDLIEKVKYYLQHNDEMKETAKRGWHRVHECYQAKSVARYMVEMTWCEGDTNRIESTWPRYAYGGYAEIS